MIAFCAGTRDCIRGTVASIVMWFGGDPFAPTASTNSTEDIVHDGIDSQGLYIFRDTIVSISMFGSSVLDDMHLR